MSNIQKQIERNILFLKEVEDIAEKISIPNNNEKEMLFYGFFRTSLSHYCAINILCEKKLYNSAFSLIRLLFEAIIKAEYLYCAVSSKKIHDLYNGRNWNNPQKYERHNAFPKIHAMCSKIDTQYGGTFYSDIINNKSYAAMNDYTHTGFKQICRNFNQENGTIEPNFDEELIMDCLISVKTMVRILSKRFFEKIGLKYEKIQEEDIEKFLEYSNS
jgi:hypothetical protein